MFKRFLLAAMALFSFASVSKADISDGQFSTNQIFDVQYYWSGNTLNASSFIAPYDMNFVHPTVNAGDYFKFFPSTTNPGTYGLGLYTSAGALKQVVHNTGTLQAIGPDALFYVGSGFFGTVITTSAGYAYGQSGTFTNMDTSVSATDASSYTWASTTPLAAGQTASTTPVTPPAPTPSYVSVNPSVVNVYPTSNNSPASETAAKALDATSGTKYLNFDRANAGFTIKLPAGKVVSALTFTTANDFVPRDPTKFTLQGSNDGVNWTPITTDQAITLSDSRYTTSAQVSVNNTTPYVYYFITFTSIKAIDQYGSVAGCQAALGTLACDSVQIGDVNFLTDSNNTATSTDAAVAGARVVNPGAPAPVVTNGTPRVVSTQPVAGTPTVTTTTVQRTVNGVDSNGNPTVTTYNDTVTTTTTPYTTSTTTTPVIITTYSDGTSTTTNGTPVTTTSSTSTTSTATTQGGISTVATTAQVAGTPVIARGTTTTTSVDTPGTTIVTNSAVRGTTITTSSFVDHASKTPRVIDVKRDTTVVRTTPIYTTYTYTTPVLTTFTSVTPITTTITTTPITTITDANGNVISSTATGPGIDTVTNSTETVVTTSNRNDITAQLVNSLEVTSSTSSKTNSVSATGLSNSIKFRNNTLVMGSPLDRADGAWAEPFAMFQNSHGAMSTQGASMGYQTTVENNTVGGSLDINVGDTKSKNGSTTEYSSYNGSAYILTKQDYFWYKGQIGYASTFHNNKLSIQDFGLYSTNKARQNNLYVDNTIYAPNAWYGFRPYAGVLVNRSSIDQVTMMGSQLLFNTPDKKSTTYGVPYAGLRYEFDKNITIDYRATQSPDFKTVHGVRATVKKEIADDVYLQFTLGSEKGSRGYTNNYGMVGLVWKF